MKVEDLEDDFDETTVENDGPTNVTTDVNEDMFDLDFGDDTEEEVKHEEEETPVADNPEDVPGEETEEEPEVTEEEVEETTEEEDEEIFTPFVNLMMEKGVLAIDPNKEYEDSEEGFTEVIQDTINAKLKEKLDSLPDDVKRLIEISEKGGSIKEAFEEAYSFDYNDIDMSLEDNKVELVKEHLLAQGYEESELDEMIDDLKDLNKLDKHATVAQKYFVQKQEADREAYVQKVENQKLERERQEQETIKEVMHKIDTIEAFGAFKDVPKADREAFKDYLFKVGEDGKTQAQRDNTLENILATEFNKFKKFDYSGLERRAKTTTTINWKKKAQRIADSNQEAKSNSQKRYNKPEDPNVFALGEIE